MCKTIMLICFVCTLKIFQKVIISADVATAVCILRGRINAKKVTATLRPRQRIVGELAITYPSLR